MTGDFELRLGAVFAAILIDAAIGEPPAIWQRIPHPVVLMGEAVAWLDRKFNPDNAKPEARRAAGKLVAALIVGAGLLVGSIAGVLIDLVPLGGLVEAIAVVVILAGRSLYDAVAAVGSALANDGVSGGRTAVARIVGRDPETLDEAGVARAGIESLAENFSDGVIAPVFWYLLLGLPGLIAYKAVNTADSMIGYRTPRHIDFGSATARLDDVLNWVPARLTGSLVVMAALVSGGDWRHSVAAMGSDADRHRSPNAGWPEAAMAGALGLALAGPRRYGGQMVDDALMNAGGRRDARPGDIAAALGLYVTANGVLLLGLGLALIAAII